MSGTKNGGIQAAATNKDRYGKDFYVKIGAKGGKKTGVKKGFAANPTLAAAAGRKGGKISKRGKAKKK
jgi:general stress protein YciG